MPDDYAKLCQQATYTLTGHGHRTVRVLLDGLAGTDPATAADIYGVGPVINDFETELAGLLGKPAAVFFPSGVMAQQIALRLWCDAAGNPSVAYHPLCHLEIHEQDAIRALHRLEPVCLGQADRLFTLADLMAVDPAPACLLIELPQREIGGQLPAWDDLVAMADYCRAHGIRTHLDGARLFETLPYYRKTAAEIAALFDSVYVSFYKGLGSVAGAMLAGEADFMAEATIWKRRHGGDLISLYPYTIAARHWLHRRADRMEAYWRAAQTVAAELNAIPGVDTVPRQPVCNMFHVYFDAPVATVEAILGDITRRYDLAIAPGLRPVDQDHCKAEMSFGDAYDLVPADLRQAALAAFAQRWAER